MTLKEEEEEETFESDVITSSSPPFPPERRTSFSSEAEVSAFVRVFAFCFGFSGNGLFSNRFLSLSFCLC